MFFIGVTKPENPKPFPNAKLTRSTDSLNSFAAKDMPHHEISAIAEGSRETSFEFKTPTAYERRSRISTPLSTAANRR